MELASRQSPPDSLANLHAVVPVKRLERAKSRLAAVLAPAERRLLVLEMLGRVLATLCRSPLAAIWVVSGDPLVLAQASRYGARPLREREGELNSALEHARAVAIAAGADALLIVPADVPLLRADDVRGMLGLLRAGADVALAPDDAGLGTNALALRATAGLPFSFGEESALRHMGLAAERGLVARRFASPTLELDVDDPVSLARYRALALPPPLAPCALCPPGP